MVGSAGGLGVWGAGGRKDGIGWSGGLIGLQGWQEMGFSFGSPRFVGKGTTQWERFEWVVPQVRESFLQARFRVRNPSCE